MRAGQCRAQRTQRPVAGKTAQPVYGRSGKRQAHGALRTGKEPVFLHMGKENFIQPGRAGNVTCYIHSSGSHAAHQIGKIGDGTGVRQALRQRKAIPFRAGAGGVQTAQERLERGGKALTVVLEQQKRRGRAAERCRGGDIIFKLDQGTDYAPLRLKEHARSHARAMIAQCRAAQVPCPAEQRCSCLLYTSELKFCLFHYHRISSSRSGVGRYLPCLLYTSCGAVLCGPARAQDGAAGDPRRTAIDARDVFAVRRIAHDG